MNEIRKYNENQMMNVMMKLAGDKKSKIVKKSQSTTVLNYSAFLNLVMYMFRSPVTSVHGNAVCQPIALGSVLHFIISVLGRHRLRTHLNSFCGVNIFHCGLHVTSTLALNLMYDY